MAPVTSTPSAARRRLVSPRAGWRALGGLVFAVSAAPLVWHYLGAYPREIWQVDLEVYREGARSLVSGYPLYDLRTEAPQLLPFTYPPFAAVVGLPLVLAPFPVMGWMWAAFQLGLLWLSVGLAFRPFLARFAVRRGLVHGVVAAGCVWMLPVAEGIRFGQVNALIVALCLVDVARRESWLRAVPRGVLVGVAAAVKLTPAVFWVHWALARRWSVLRASVTAAVVATLTTAVVLPAQSAQYWTDAFLDPQRLGPNAGTSNQSLRGVLLRLGPSPGPALSVLWLLAVLVTSAAGFAVSVRLERAGEAVAVVATVGLVAFLVSPVSWVHHLQWGVVVVGALLGDARRPTRVLAAAAAAGMLWMRLPWWGITMIAEGFGPKWAGRTVQNGYTLFAVLGIAAMWWLIARGSVDTGAAAAAASGVSPGHDSAGEPLGTPVARS